MDAKCKLIQLALEKVSNSKYGIKSIFNHNLFNKFIINNYPICRLSFPIKTNCLKLDTCENNLVYENPIEESSSSSTIESSSSSVESSSSSISESSSSSNISSSSSIIEESSSSSVPIIDCYEDWYLPNYNEMAWLFSGHLFLDFGTFPDKYYWTSTEINSNQARAKYFGLGTDIILNKNILCYVRPIRQFLSNINYSLYTPIEGGKIFYREAGSFGGYQYRYLVAATQDIPFKAVWGTLATTTGATSTTIFEGTTNTFLIVSNDLLTEDKAADYCYELQTGTECPEESSSSSSSNNSSSSSLESSSSSGEICYNDWYLPSLDEFQAIVDAGLVNLSDTNKAFCSSSEYNAAHEWSYMYGLFSIWEWAIEGKSGDSYIIPVRDFRSTSDIAIGTYIQGGVIFYKMVDFYGVGDHKYLVSATEDATVNKVWGNPFITTGATNTAIGTGNINTLLILANDTTPDKAADYCDELIVCEDFESSSVIEESSSSSSVESSSNSSSSSSIESSSETSSSSSSITESSSSSVSSSSSIPAM